MPVSTLVVTAGSASANAYCTRAFADQYWLDRPAPTNGTAWSAATDAQKDSAILWATQLLDSLYQWNGNVVTSTQALLWPRAGLLHNSGYVVDYTLIPIELQRACAEFARQLLATDRAADSDIETQGITSIRAGSIALTFKDTVRAKVVPDAVRALLPPSWGYIRSTNTTRQLVRA